MQIKLKFKANIIKQVSQQVQQRKFQSKYNKESFISFSETKHFNPKLSQKHSKHPMLIEQIIKKQTINILDAILQTQSQSNGQPNQSTNLKSYTPQQYTSLHVLKGIIKEDQTQILLILINQYFQTQNPNQNNEFQSQQHTFTLNDAYVMLKQIKKSIIEQGQTQKAQNNNNAHKKQLQSGPKNNQSSNKNTINQSISHNQPSQAQNGKNSHRSNHQQPTQQHNEQQFMQKQLGQMSKKLKKQNQFITRNIDRIKKYANNSSDATLPLERSQLQQIKISHQISHKLFHLYKPIYPSSMSNNKNIEMNNFETKEQYKSTLNYHKVLEIFIDAPIKLQIQNKLSLLRIIKKFSFNPNLIQLEEWTKIYRAIINNLGVKQITLQRLVKTKEEEKKNTKLPVLSIASKQKSQNSQYRSRRIKTQVSIPEARLTSLNNIDKITDQYQSQKNIQYMSNKSAIRPIEPQQRTQVKSYNPNEHRSRHKKLLTDVSEVFIKNVKRDLRSEKMIGLQDNKKQDKNQSQVLGQEVKNEYSYLKKAIKNKKIGKITWQSLFQMKQDTIHHNIVIPQFAKLLDQENY